MEICEAKYEHEKLSNLSCAHGFLSEYLNEWHLINLLKSYCSFYHIKSFNINKYIFL